MKPWSAFYPDVAPELSGAPLPMVDHWLRNTTIEFCDRTKALVVDLDPEDSVENQMEYELSMPTGTDIVEIIEVIFNGVPLIPKSPAFLKEKYGDWKTKIGDPAFYTQQDNDNILLVPAPGAALVGSLKVKAAVKPNLSATGIDDWLFAKFRMALAAGVKGKMMLMDKKPWASPAAPVHLGTFEDAVSKATVKAADGLVRSRPRFKGRFF